jgi:hypothetical protein
MEELKQKYCFVAPTPFESFSALFRTRSTGPTQFKLDTLEEGLTVPDLGAAVFAAPEMMFSPGENNIADLVLKCVDKMPDSNVSDIVLTGGMY